MAVGESYEQLARSALNGDKLYDLMEGGENPTPSWCVRLRQYGDAANLFSPSGGKGKR